MDEQFFQQMAQKTHYARRRVSERNRRNAAALGAEMGILCVFPSIFGTYAGKRAGQILSSDSISGSLEICFPRASEREETRPAGKV